MTRCTDPAFRYTKVEDQGPHYLERKFAKLRRELKERDAAQVKINEEAGKKLAKRGIGR